MYNERKSIYKNANSMEQPIKDAEDVMTKLPYEVFTSDEVKQIEADYAQNHNGHCFGLMQKAGRAVFDFIVKNCSEAKEVWIFCGKGNNGGDGYIVAGLLQDHGIKHRVFSTGLSHEGSEAAIAYDYYIKLGGRIEYELPNNGIIPEKSEPIIAFSKPDIIIDALLGTGIESAPTGVVAKWIAYINALDTFTVAVDVPSGVCSDTGTVRGMSVCANATVCMLALKPGLLTSDAVDFVGEIEFASLGVDTVDYHEILSQNSYKSPLPIVQVNYEDVIDLLPVRFPSYNKGDNGKVLIISGAEGMGGAAIICGNGALRAGAGLVKVAVDKVNIPAIIASRPELMTVDLNDDEMLQNSICWADAIAIGPGLGVNKRTARLLEFLADLEDQNLVYDADALNVLATKEEDFYRENRILTPHPGEASRLLGVSIEEICADRILSCYKLQRKYGGVVLLKGPGSIVCDGQRLTIVHEGSSALATGGSGDLLTGIIVSLLGQGLSPAEATIVGAALHGKAGMIAGNKKGIIGTMPMDLCQYVRELINVKN